MCVLQMYREGVTRLEDGVQITFGALPGRELHRRWGVRAPRGREVTAVAVSPVPVPQSPLVGSAADGGGIVPCCAPTAGGSADGAKSGGVGAPTAGFSIRVVVDSASDSLESDQSASRRKTRLCGMFKPLCKLPTDNKGSKSTEQCFVVRALTALHCN